MGTRRNIISPAWPRRYSLNSVLVLIALTSLYLGGWEITKRWTLANLLKESCAHCTTPIPYLAVVDELDVCKRQFARRGYICCLGLKVPLPYVRECSEHIPVDMGLVIARITVRAGEEKRLGIVPP